MRAEVSKFEQNGYVDAVRWMPHVAALDRLVATSSYNPDTGASLLQIHSLLYPQLEEEEEEQQQQPQWWLQQQGTWEGWRGLRLTAMRVAAPEAAAPNVLIAAADGETGHLLLALADPLQASLEASFELPPVRMASPPAPMAAFDLNRRTCDCVCAGSDGRVTVVTGVADGRLQRRPVLAAGASGLADSSSSSSSSSCSSCYCYSAARWASPWEFFTAGQGMSLHMWDQRLPRGLVWRSPFLARNDKSYGGILHSIDVHASRKHTCVAGGSFGTVLSWDTRKHEEPVLLVGAGLGQAQPSDVLSESEIWEVQYDSYTQSAGPSITSGRIMPVMMCSEDGILGVLEAGEAPREVLAEPCAINTFDIDPDNASDVICAAEWESIIFLRRSYTS